MVFGYLPMSYMMVKYGLILFVRWNKTEEKEDRRQEREKRDKKKKKISTSFRCDHKIQYNKLKSRPRSIESVTGETCGSYVVTLPDRKREEDKPSCSST